MALHFKKIGRILGIITLFLLISAFALGEEKKLQGTIPVKGENKAQYSALAKISIQDAMMKASKSVPGKLIEIVLEEEDGFLIYEAEVVAENKMKKEVVIDAGSGTILQIRVKSPSQ